MAEQRVNILVYRPDGTMIAQYLLGDGEHLIGRDINCPVYLDSEYISSNHAKLYLSHDGIQIEDLNSTSGTYLDGVTVRGKLRIKPGQVLQVGDLTVHLQPESEGQIGPGSRLGDGRYTLVRMLGKGGMGEVWLAKDEQLDEEVALKRLPHEVGADAMALADMRREVQKSRALSHPNIVRIHDLVQQAGEDPLISLEYVDGTDLTAIAATKPNGVFNWSDIKDWVLQLATALEYAHEEKIVHRDLKPGNIMISRNGRLKLADFGIAATVADATRRSSMEGFISGTTLYMSPQQMEGKPPKVTDDVYALGATIYELLTSRPPFYTGNVEHQVLNVTPAPPSQRLSEFGFTGEIPPYVQELVMACLAKDPSGRPQSMGLIRQWIETEGKAQDIIPKPTTKTIKQGVPVAVTLEPQGVGEKADNNESNNLWVYIIGVIFVLVCFIAGKKMGDGKSDESSAVLPESLTQGLVAYYPFNGNADDESVNGNNGTVAGGSLANTNRLGENDRAWAFDGVDDYVDILHHESLNLATGGLTLSAWIRPDDNRISAIISKGDSISNNEAYNLAIISDELHYSWRVTANGSLPNISTTNAPLKIGDWTNVTLTHQSGSPPTLYINGVANNAITSSEDLTQPRMNNGEPLRLGSGKRSGDPHHLLKGKLDDVRIYNRALSVEEVKALYEFEKAN